MCATDGNKRLQAHQRTIILICLLYYGTLHDLRHYGQQKAEIPMLAEITTAQCTDKDFRTVSTSAGKLYTRFNVNSGGVLVRVSPLDCTSRRVVPASLGPCFHQLCHYFLLDWHPRERRLYNAMRGKMYWHRSANNIHATVHNCRSYAQNRGHVKRQQELNLFFRNSLLDYIDMGLLQPIPKNTQGYQLVVMMMVPYNKLTKATRTTKTDASAVACIFLEDRVASYNISCMLLADRGPLLVSKFFVAICWILG